MLYLSAGSPVAPRFMPKDSSLPDQWSHSSHRYLLGALLVLLLWPALMIFPYTLGTDLDASWQTTLVYARTQGWQFGRDLIFTWGPWGFLHNFVHLGDAAATVRLTWELLGKLLLAVGLVAGSRALPPVRQTVFVVACVLCVPVFQDCAYLLFITVAVLAVLLRPGAHRAELLAFVTALAFLSQIKFTYALLAGAGVGLACAVQSYGRRWPAAALTGGGFVLAFLGWWLAAGQHPDNIVPYLRRSWEISTGYADAMSMDESLPVFLCGLTVLCFQGLLVWRVWRRQTDRVLATGLALFLLVLWFLTWKHGFTRADGHVLSFFLLAVPATLAIPALCLPDERRLWFDLAVIPCLAGLWFFDPALPAKLPGEALSRLRVNVVATYHSPTLPAAWRAEWERTRAANALPAIRQKVGRASVDVFNYEQGFALLNGLNFSPRPVFQGYSTYTPRLAGRNLRHYQSAAAPEYLLWHHTSIDERFPTLDEAPLIAELPRAYREILTEGDFLLLHREKPLPAVPLARELLQQQTVALGEFISVPAAPGGALWVQIFPHATKLGRLRALLYKPGLLTLTVEEVTGRQTTWRLLPRVAEGGFLLQPFLETQADFSAYLRGRGLKQIRTLRLDAPDGEFWKGAELRFSALPGLPVANEAGYHELVARGITNVAPLRVEMPARLEIFTLGSHQAVLAHAPGTMTFTLPASARSFSGACGLRENAYLPPASTDGVDFVIEAVWADHSTQILWQRSLDPVRRPGDRGPQTFTVDLPATPRPTQIILRTRPGAAGDARWDWSFWSRLRFDP